jgi:hypothetical protein
LPVRSNSVQILFPAIVLLACAWSFRRPVWAVVLMIFLFSIQQVLQAEAPWVRGTPLGNQLINYVVGSVAIFAAGITILRKREAFVGWVNFSFVVITALLAWSVVTLLWSPGRDLALQVLSLRWVYYVIFILVGPIIIADLDDIAELLRGLLVAGIVLCLVINVSSGFESQYGRIGILEAGKLQSNPLALGELGGVVLITGALLRTQSFGRLSLLLRIAAVVLGAMTAIKSGSRGQMLFAASIATIGYPFSARIRNIGSFVAGVVGMALIGLLVVTLASTLLEGFAAKRFSVEELLYGSSSTSERISNVGVLASAWASSPIAVFVGVGYYAFSSFGLGIEYSHVVAADMLFELGIPGAVLYLCLVVREFGVCRWLLRVGRDDDVMRPVTALYVSLVLFYFLLSNKQGDLWGIVTLFMLVCAADRVRARAAALPDQAEFDGSREESASA